MTRELRQMQVRHRREVAALRRELAALRTARAGSAAEGTSQQRADGSDRDGGTGHAGPADDTVDLRAYSAHGYGLYAASEHGTGIHCRSFGAGDGLSALSEQGIGIAAMSLGGADGVYAQSALGNGVHAVGGAALGNGRSPRPAGVFAEGGSGCGVYAEATTGDGVIATSASGYAVDACSDEGTGLRARSAAGLALEIEGRIRVRGCAVGEACLQEGARTHLVASAAATADSLILLSPLDDPGHGVRIWVSARDAGTFAISASAPARARIRVQYMIIN